MGKKLLQMAGIEDCYTSAKGSTGTLGNFAKATYAAIAETYSYLTPDLWKETVFTKSPYQEFTDFLQEPPRRRCSEAGGPGLLASQLECEVEGTRFSLNVFLKTWSSS